MEPLLAFWYLVCQQYRNVFINYTPYILIRFESKYFGIRIWLKWGRKRGNSGLLVLACMAQWCKCHWFIGNTRVYVCACVWICFLFDQLNWLLARNAPQMARVVRCVCVCVCCTYFWRAPCSPSAVVAALVPVPVPTPAPAPAPVPYLVALAFLLRFLPTVPLRIKMSSHKSSVNYIIIVLLLLLYSLVFFLWLGAPCLSALATGHAYHHRAAVIGQATWACLQVL